mmetsp:Transcript_6306/g.20551  ORF Transcript_6306/g.20551 Transcript_6306/m.20551 type:complete len:254 (+) Transcript_6306:1667-2428(+)
MRSAFLLSLVVVVSERLVRSISSRMRRFMAEISCFTATSLTNLLRVSDTSPCSRYSCSVVSCFVLMVRPMSSLYRSSVSVDSSSRCFSFFISMRWRSCSFRFSSSFRLADSSNRARRRSSSSSCPCNSETSLRSSSCCREMRAFSAASASRRARSAAPERPSAGPAFSLASCACSAATSSFISPFSDPIELASSAIRRSARAFAAAFSRTFSSISTTSPLILSSSLDTLSVSFAIAITDASILSILSEPISQK